MSWYNHDIDNIPATFKSIQPAWNDRNLLNLTSKIKSECFIAHIRASTVGDVSYTNCHPFSYGQHSLVHNGHIDNFKEIRRDIVNLIDDDLFLPIKSQTDCEHFFYLIMHFITQEKDLSQALLSAINWVVDKQRRINSKSISKINVALSDGNQIVATRYTSGGGENLSLYYSLLEKNGIIIASEKLDDYSKNWIRFEPNSILASKIENDSLVIASNPIDSL